MGKHRKKVAEENGRHKEVGGKDTQIMHGEEEREGYIGREIKE
jgi:hypothetical protein